MRTVPTMLGSLSILIVPFASDVLSPCYCRFLYPLLRPVACLFNRPISLLFPSGLVPCPSCGL